jgi:hypothetical protein
MNNQKPIPNPTTLDIPVDADKVWDGKRKRMIKPRYVISKEDWQQWQIICLQKGTTPQEEIRKFVKWTISKKGGK